MASKQPPARGLQSVKSHNVIFLCGMLPACVFHQANCGGTRMQHLFIIKPSDHHITLCKFGQATVLSEKNENHLMTSSLWLTFLTYAQVALLKSPKILYLETSEVSACCHHQHRLMLLPPARASKGPSCLHGFCVWTLCWNVMLLVALETLEELTILSSITCRTSKRLSARGLQKLWLAKLESIWLCRKRGLIRSIPTDFRINSGNSWGVPTWPFVKVKESKRKHKKMKEHESYESWRHLYYISRFYVAYQASVVAVMESQESVAMSPRPDSPWSPWAKRTPTALWRPLWPGAQPWAQPWVPSQFAQEFGLFCGPQSFCTM